MEESELLKKRKEKIEALKAEGIDLYPNDVRVKNTTEEILSRFSQMDHDALTRVEERFGLAGRIMAIRNFGKAAFISLQDRKGRLQGYIHRRLTSSLKN
jgi:lysyl-tRNA synthetase class 2